MLRDNITQDLSVALKSGDSAKVSTLRLLISAIKNKEIELRETKALEDSDVISIIKKQVKTHLESIDAFTKGGRTELVSVEEAELAILKSYLPKEMDEETLRQKVKELLESSPGADFGSSMKNVMAVLKGQADGATISKIVKELLGNG